VIAQNGKKPLARLGTRRVTEKKETYRYLNAAMDERRF